MNNIESIKEDYKIGDPIRIVCSLGIKEGHIVDFKEDRIKIRPFEEGRKPISISEDSIKDFEEALLPSNAVKKEDAKENLSGSFTQASNLSNTIENDHTNKETPDTKTPADTKSGQEFAIEEVLSQPQNTNTATENAIGTSIGHDFKPGDVIPLDVLHKIDPKLKKKSKISSSQKKASGKMNTLGNDLRALMELVKDEHEVDDMRIVPALGEVKFVKPEMNFGFIHDQ